MKVAIFIGRFQPLHKGHLHVIRVYGKRFEKLVIGIGSVNKHDINNPFSFEERREMFRRAGISCEVVGIEDVGNDEKWSELVMEKANFDVVITGSDWVERCFRGKKEVLKIKLFKPEKYNGTRIRRLMAEGKEWKSLVHPKVYGYIKEIGGEERVRRLLRYGNLAR